MSETLHLIFTEGGTNPCSGEPNTYKRSGFLPSWVPVTVDTPFDIVGMNVHVKFNGDTRTLRGLWEITNKQCTVYGAGETASIALSDFLKKWHNAHAG